MFKRNALSLILGTLIIGTQGVAVAAIFDENAYGNDRHVMTRPATPEQARSSVGGPGFDENAYGRDRIVDTRGRTFSTTATRPHSPGFDENAYGRGMN